MKKKTKSLTHKLKTRTIHVESLARVEGEGALYVRTCGNKVQDVQLKIFEPPRFFEAFLRGRAYTEAPDITARICGICPVAYQMSAVHAVENAFGVIIPPYLRELRRLLYCGEWIESHTLHVYMLHAPDFLGFEDAIRMAKDHPKEVERGLQLKKAGNEIVKLFGGREIHPINVKVGGFYKLPCRLDAAILLEKLKKARDAALETVLWVAEFPFPQFELDYEFVALAHPNEYPFNEGRLISNRGLDIDIRDYDKHFEETHVAHTNALHSTLTGRGEYFVGPMARYNLNADRLSPLVKSAREKIGFPNFCKNPFQSIIVRSLEVLYACDEAVRILTNYSDQHSPAVEILPRVGTGHAGTEAPRGILYHRYRFAEDGKIEDAKIVPPTSQNQKTIESDLRQLVEKSINLSQTKLVRLCEQAIRNYDPCISCATHFLKLEVTHE